MCLRSPILIKQRRPVLMLHGRVPQADPTILLKHHRPAVVLAGASEADPDQPVRVLGRTKRTWTVAAVNFFMIAGCISFVSLYFWVMLIPAAICLVISGSLDFVYHLLC
jgi:hypothetical protein